MAPAMKLRANVSGRRAFSLIELLIVVAIIAILAAIAVPNFLEAQVRSKVSRAKADLRTMATGLEAYFTDTNSYPDFVSIISGVFITTPVAYLTSLPEDVFRQHLPADVAIPFNFRNYGYGAMEIINPSRYVLESAGPDLDMDTYISTGAQFDPDITALAFYPGYSPDLFSETGVSVNNGASYFKYIMYDPTNGTVSSGDIFRVSDYQFGK
jgi:prepilin-type N-terminal cleavage/methylation domain-containing protein